jgi:hypothetical protein
MSLAMFAAPFDENSNNDSFTNNSDNILNKKRQQSQNKSHNKTQKMYPKENFDTNKVNNILEKIHNSLDEDDDDTDNFNPPPKPVSIATENTVKKEQMMNMTSTNDLMFRTLGRAPQPNYENTDGLDLNDYTNYGNSKTNEEYYKKVLPGYTGPPPNLQKNMNNKPYYGHATYQQSMSSNDDILLQKLNYMISLLEDQQDEKTNHVTEEVVLYSFLGIFIIFIADTFVRAGKYVR